jgi:hypothetical protein
MDVHTGTQLSPSDVSALIENNNIYKHSAKLTFLLHTQQNDSILYT